MRRKNNIGMLFICGMAAVTVSGCGSKNVTNCEVLSVDGSVSGSTYLCENGSSTYVYENDAIRDADTGETLTHADDLAFMACTESELLFYTTEYGGSLYAYRFKEEKTEELSQDYYVTGMKAHGDEIFVNARRKDYKNNKEETYAYALFVCEDDGTVEDLTEWVKTQEPEEENEHYAVYRYGDYLLTTDLTLAQETPQLVCVEEETSGFVYSCLPYNTYSEWMERWSVWKNMRRRFWRSAAERAVLHRNLPVSQAIVFISCPSMQEGDGGIRKIRPSILR